jgi:hypothetical protein
MLYHVWITPDDHRASFGVKKWNLSDDQLMRQFVEPYRTGRPITCEGETVQMDCLRWMRIARSEDQLNPQGDLWRMFDGLEQLTDDYLQGPPGYAADTSVGTASVANTTSQVVEICSRFPRIANALRMRSHNRAPLAMDDEYDVQYLMRALLEGQFRDVRPEEWTPSYAGGSARMDFLLHEEQIVVEAKRSRNSMTTRTVGDELLADIGRYGAHPRCRTLICFVYDPEHRLENPRALENDLSGARDGLDVRVLVKPSL